jgi:hypothetical protein
LDISEADRAREQNLNHVYDRREQARRESRESPETLAPRLELAARAGRIATGNDLRCPERVLTVGETLLALGCTLEQAIAGATWYSTLVAVWVFDDTEANEVEEQAAPDWQALARHIGTSISVAEVKAAIKKGVLAVSKWDARHPRPKGKQ